MEKIDDTPYDDVFRTMVTDLPRITLKLINEMFASSLSVKYSGDEKVEQLSNSLNSRMLCKRRGSPIQGYVLQGQTCGNTTWSARALLTAL